MTVLGGIGVALWLGALIGFIVLCVRAKELPAAEADERSERASSATLYPTRGRDVHATVVNLMHTGMPDSEAVARALDFELSHRTRGARR